MHIIDFETVSELDVRAVGAWAYAAHPSTRVRLMAYKNGTGATRVWQAGEPFPKIDPSEGIVAHNAEFELAIWSLVLPRTAPGVPRLLPQHLDDTAARASACGFPRSLDALGAALKLPVRKQTAVGTKLIKLWSRMPIKDPREDPKSWQQFIDYCVVDVETTAQAHLALSPLPPFERALYTEHLCINARGIGVDLPRVKRLDRIRIAAEDMLQNDEYGELLTRPLALVTWLSALGCDLPDARAATFEEALTRPDLDPRARALIVRRLEIAKASVKKYRKIVMTTTPDGRLRGMHVYHAAHTGRFAGTGVQVQNLVRACVADLDWNIELLDSLPDDPTRAVEALGSPGDALLWTSWMVRPMLKAGTGRVLAAADYSAIEARELAWLARAEVLQAAYVQHLDPYRIMASLIYKISPGKISSHQRWVGKQVVLGCGYGLGHLKFLARCAVEGVELSEEEARTAVRAYRKTNHEIPTAWKRLDHAVLEALMTGNRIVLFGGKIMLWAQRHEGRAVALCCRLPSGRVISWKYPRMVRIPPREPSAVDEEVLTYLTPQKGPTVPLAKVIQARALDLKINPKDYLRSCTAELPGFVRVTSWGGKLMENIIQAIARDVLAEAILRVSKHFPVVLHVHDEVVVELSDSKGQDKFMKLMAVTPPWNQGAVISVEGWSGERYRKA